MFELPQPEQGEYQLEGWQAAGDLTQAEIQYNQWQTLLIDGQQLPICRFDYTNTNGQSATFVGGLNAQRNVCEGSRDMRWYNDYQIDSPVGSMSYFHNLVQVMSPTLRMRRLEKCNCVL